MEAASFKHDPSKEFKVTPEMMQAFEVLLGDKELYHLSSKLVMKAPRSGGQFCWHQDYGYFYENGLLYPDCGSVSIPVDPCTSENGCLKIVAGSHLLGRLDHHRRNDLASVDEERLKHITARLKVYDAVMEPGDALFFHGNIIHTSGPNLSDTRRWNLVLAYNQVENAPINNEFLPKPEPLLVVEDSDIVKKGRMVSTVDKKYIKNKDDTTTSSLGNK